MLQSIEIFEQSIRHFLAPIESLLTDPTVSEVMIIGHDVVYFERAGRIQKSDATFPDAASLAAAVRNIGEFAGRRIDDETPYMDARLPDGSRVHVIGPPCARQGVCLTIRRFQRASLDLDGLIARNSLTEEAAEFLGLAVQVRRNILVSGGTGSGKTSLLNALSARIPEGERILVIEDSSELRLAQPHTVYLEARPPRPDGRGEVSIRTLFVNALRMRPDRIVVGEVRRGEALDMVQSMISGHGGALSTIHASTPRDAMTRLETLCMLSDASLPARVARVQVASAIHLIAQIERSHEGPRRVRTISEVVGLDDQGRCAIVDLYRHHSGHLDGGTEGGLRPTGVAASFAAEVYEQGYGDQVRLTAAVLPPPKF